MSQYYPPQGPMYPPEQPPEDYYYYEEGEFEYDDADAEEGAGSLLQLGLAFLSGGCLVFLCMSFCALLLVVLWVLDPGAGLSATPEPGSEIGLSFDGPAFPGEAVVNSQGLQLTVLDVNRNAALETVSPVEGREVIIVTIELVNLGEETASFNERDFSLLNSFQEVYPATVGAVTGALGRGSLPPSEGLEGRLVFEVIEGDLDLRLLWEPRDAEARYLYLQ